MSAHTKTPWRFYLGTRGATATIQDAAGYEFATVDDGENAAFIVRAVNAHGDLVAMLERLETKGAGGWCPLCGGSPPHCYDCELAALLREVRGE